MLTTEFEPWLESAVSEVLESMCFMSTVGEDLCEDLSGQEQEWVAMRLSFVGKASGSFGVSAPLGTARLIAANFLGEDENELEEVQAVEVMGEIANMACGTLLARMESKQAFTLTSPVRDLADNDVAPHIGRLHRTFSLDEGTLHTWLEIGAAV